MLTNAAKSCVVALSCGYKLAIINKNRNYMKHEILEGKKLTEYQKKVLHVISDSSEKNYILEVLDLQQVKTTYTITNGEDDFKDVRESTMKKLKLFDFLRSKILPSSDMIVRTKYFIPERFRTQVFLACL